ncbi:MAG: hypothetical protein JSV88_24090 [Candidatus Aminicenantes bacterium]|nr:MAG: hypothetical protein JSV88_24090 [Candidatus Aminicenantes bacterium]
MTKSRANVKDKSQADRIKSPKETYKAEEERATSRRKRKLIPPAKPSRIPEKVIIKAIEEVMAERSFH